MHQLASSIISFFLSPFNVVIVLLIAMFFLRKASWKKACGILALCIFVVFGNQWLLNLYAKNWQPAPTIIDSSLSFSCGIVPGGFASPDANANGYFNASADRFIQVVKLYKLGSMKHILISGGNGKTEEKSFREGAWVREELKSVGIPDSVIFVEDRSNNTADNAFYAKKILDSLHFVPPFLLITSAYHMPRASLIFKKAGLATVPFPCNYFAGMGGFSVWDLLPRPTTLLGWEPYLKETAGYFLYKIK
jgi:uncharacterized SAM-binding protein YcdF (DUF218 family)